ncbi:MAG: HAMP domain-containing histidine kinase [Elainella sp. Prado103]|jgi:signal transduction histidine kinase|nr:HAMP domain-containing histidine kinase [Elainella sp. Prado103]
MLRVLLVTNQNLVQAIVAPWLQSFAMGFFCQSDRACILYHLERYAINCIVVDITDSDRAELLTLMTALQPYGLPPIVGLTGVAPLEAGDGSLEQLTAAGVWEVFRLPGAVKAGAAKAGNPESDAEASNAEAFVRLIRWVIRTHQAEKQAKLAHQQLEQDEAQLKQQVQVIDRQMQRIQQLNLQLLEATQLKGQFLSTISHELRTPMNAILGFSQILLRRGSMLLSTHQMEMISRIHDNAKRLLHAIEEILTFCNIEAGHLKLHPRWINLDQLIRSVVQELESEAAVKQLPISIEVDLPSPLVMVDPTQLQQVLFTLISNAIKFTPHGIVQVSVTHQVADEQYIISIRDTGNGIQPTEIEHIFEPFRQGDQSITRIHNGIGLGLALTAALVEQMQGTIQVRSVVGQGSEFRVILPYWSQQSDMNRWQNQERQCRAGQDLERHPAELQIADRAD